MSDSELPEHKLPEPYLKQDCVTYDVGVDEDVFLRSDVIRYSEEYARTAIDAYIAKQSDAQTAQDNACPDCGLTDWRDFYTGDKKTHDVCASCDYRRGEKPSAQAAVPDIKTMVDRFLCWPVPITCFPDGVNGDPRRIGTNLLSATEAKAMFEYCLNADPDSEKGGS